MTAYIAGTSTRKVDDLIHEAADISGTKLTKTDRPREAQLDQQTVDMLVRHIDLMDERAAASGRRRSADQRAADHLGRLVHGDDKAVNRPSDDSVGL